MNRFHRITAADRTRRHRGSIRIRAICYSIAAALAGTIGLVAGAPAAFAQTAMPPADLSNVGHTTAPVQTVVTGGTPGWQIALIAIGAAFVASTGAVFLDRARAARRPLAPAVS